LSVAFLVVGVIESAVFAVVAGLHRPPTFIAVLVVAQGVGAVISGSVAARAMRRVGEVGLTAAALALFSAGTAVIAAPSLAVVLGGAVVLGAALPWLAIGPTTLVQRATPGPLVGKVSAAADMLVGTPQTISIALGAGLITLVDYRLLLVAIAIVVAATAGYLFTSSDEAEMAAVPPVSLNG
jgi:MFS family permease